MINANMRDYEYFILEDVNAYGQPQLSENIKGSVKMSITTASKAAQDSISFIDAQYIGITHDADINDKYIIEYGTERLKVLYVIPARFKQVFLSRM